MMKSENYLQFDQIFLDKCITIERLSESTLLRKIKKKEKYLLDFYGLILITSGIAYHGVADDRYALEKGNLLLIRPEVVNTFSDYNGVEGWIITFNHEYLISNLQKEFLAEEHKFKPNFFAQNLYQTNHKDQLFLEKSMASLYDVIQNDRINDLIIMHLLSSCLHVVFRYKLDDSSSSNTGDNKLIQLAFQFKILVEESQTNTRNIRYYIDQLAISQSTLNLATKLTFNCTPKHIIDQVLIGKARRLLVHTNLKIKDISLQLGFTEATNFTKFFRLNLAITPEEFRKISCKSYNKASWASKTP